MGWQSMRRASYAGWLAAALAVAAGLYAGNVDFHNDEPQAAALVLLAASFVISVAQPAKAWRWAVLATLGLPVFYAIATAQGARPVSTPEPVWWASSLGIVPALLGALGGVIVRALLGHPETSGKQE